MSYKKSSGQKFLKTAIVIFIAFLLSRQVTVFSRLLSETPHGGSDGYYYESHHHQPSSYNHYNNDTIIIATATHPTIQKDINYDPVQSLWDEYMEQHSEQVLQQEWTDFWKSTSDADGASSSNNININVSSTTLMNHNHHHFSLNGRKFAIGYYSCPLQAGNRLHHFFNSLIWSIVTNRTFLYRYFDYPTCMRITGGNLVLCNASNTVMECDAILQRNSWIPSFNDWKRRLNFQNFTSLSFWSTIEKRPKHRLWQEGISEQHAGIVDSKNNDLVVEFAQMLGQDAVILKSERKRNYLLSTTEARERARQLLSFGPDYLFGFLFAKSFAFQPSVTGGNSTTTISSPVHSTISTSDVTTTTTNSSTFPKVTGNTTTTTISSPVHATIISTASGNVSTMTKNITLPRASPSASSSPPILIVIHSRHSKLSNDGSNIQREIKCLDRLLLASMKKNSSDHHQYESSSNRTTTTTTTTTNCSIYLLSDRPMTLMLLQEHISQQYPMCQAHVAKHDYGTSFRNEHGPYAGIGFYQDLAMVQNGILLQSLPATIITTATTEASLPNKIGFIGSERRSSSQLVRELMVYHHHRTRLAQQDLPLLLSNANNSSVDEILGLTTCYL